MPTTTTTKELFLQLGLSESKVEETLKNSALTTTLKQCLVEYSKLTGRQISAVLGAGEGGGGGTGSADDKKLGVLMYQLATKLKPSTTKFLPLILNYIIAKKIDTELRLTSGLKYLLDRLSQDSVNVAEFEAACGVGVVVSAEDIEHCVQEAIDKFRADLLATRYKFNIGRLMTHIKTGGGAAGARMMWADGAELKAEVDLQVKLLLGPKTAEDLKPAVTTGVAGAGGKGDGGASGSGGKNKDVKVKQPTPAATAAAAKESAAAEPPLDSFEKIGLILQKLTFHRPGANFTTEGYPSSPNVLALLAQHNKRIGGQVRTRFPPEPNGILHIGHAKAININFGYAKVNNGLCFLRYDDTNPEKEEERFFKSIHEMVQWLGYTPYRVTHASDYFQELYEWALVLIKKGLAYVCHQKADEIKGFNPPPSPWRDRPVQENYLLFENMKNGLFDEGAATLRMKITLEEGKQDPVAYRVRFVAHPKAGDKWCIYPTYDFTHCLCDSVEDITHSMCTKEFSNRRSSYYWLCEAVDTYVPVQWEYGRLNVSYTVVSKRKIAKLIEEKIVNDWDDPRLFTLPALRRRGFPPEALNEFCVRMGITGATITVDPAMIEACVRDCLNLTAPRTMVVMNALRVRILNPTTPDGGQWPKTVSVADLAEGGASHDVVFDSVIYIDGTDFKEKADKGYKRFAGDQTVGLRHANVVLKCEEIVRAAAGGQIEEVKVRAYPVGGEGVDKPKGFIHWVSRPIELEIRLYERLFHHKHPEDKSEVPGGFLSDCNLDSLKVERGLGDAHLLPSATVPFKQFQFERMGYFAVDPDSVPNKLVFNRTVSLKEDAGKK